MHVPRSRIAGICLCFAAWLALLPAAVHAGQFHAIPSKDTLAEPSTPFGFRPIPHGLERMTQKFRADRLASWVGTVLRHEPGRLEDSAERVSGWSTRELAELLVDLEGLGAAVEKVGDRAHADRLGMKVRVRDWEGTFDDAIALLGLAPEHSSADDFTRLVQRGVLLHTDVAVLAAEAQSAADIGRELPSTSLHFGVAMTLVGLLGRTPSAAGFSRAWYRGVMGFLQLHHEIVAAPLLVERAVSLYPDDVVLLMSAGSVYEMLGSPVIQDRDVLRESGFTASIGTGPANLRKAERFFRAALRREPDNVEARARLGRVLGGLGRQADALAELREAARLAADPPASYFAWLFLGDAEAAAGHSLQARHAYGEALRIAPFAQSCWLSISRLARREGDRSGALDATRRTLEADETTPDDPWIHYYNGPAGRRAGTLLRAIWDAARRQP
jgi:tetratricopeptide (TPR) repeat protein